MEFTSNLFVIFVVFFFGLYFLIDRYTEDICIRNGYIAWMSLFFYAVWYPPALILVLLHSLMARYGGLWIEWREHKKLPLAVVVSISLGILAFFKYCNFFLEAASLTQYRLDIILPLGISFYTFTVIGYYVDLYRGDVPAVDSVTDAALFISFWPHLASGPILRADNIFQNMKEREPLTLRNVTLALVLVGTGVVKKILIADNIGAYVNWNLSFGVKNMNILECWSVVTGFAAQIYADFSGYSDMAIGFALLMGFRLPANFNYPYRSTSLTEFWRRWHISLSFWFRDYLYFPLGGNRKGKFRMHLNILIVFVLSGLWHGAAYNFIIWGALHGAVLVIEKVFERVYFRIHGSIRWVITFIIVMVAWAFFRLDHTTAFTLVPKLFGLNGSLSFSFGPPCNIMPVFLLLLLPAADHLLRFYRVSDDGFPEPNNSFVTIAALAVLIPAAIFFWGKPLPFIYFKF